jgi:hypothetical protein
MRRVVLLVTVVSGSGCGPVTGSNDVQRVEGEFCESGKPDEAVMEEGDWRVTMFYNFSEVRDVVEDGVHRFVEFRACASRTCMVDAEVVPTAEEAMASCRERSGLPKPLMSSSGM